MGDLSWVTLATNDSYSLGALVLAHSLKRVGTQHQLVVMVTPGVTPPMREKLSSVFNLVFEVNILDSKDERNLMLLQRPELGITFTKLHCWRLTQFKKCVFLDADTLVLQNCDELFERDEFSAAPDVGWPDCFNSGVFVYCPSDQTFNSLLTFALEKGSFDGGDQGLLNLYFSDWAHKDINKHLPFIYNMCSTASYSYLPAFKQFGENVRIIHFIGNSKPWLQYFNSETLQVQCTPGYNHLQLIFDHWWSLFCSNVHANLAPTMAWTMRIASSCTRSSHVLSNLTESKSEDSLYAEQFSSDVTIPIWDPWENYLPTNINTNPQNIPEPRSSPETNVIKIKGTNVPVTVNNNCHQRDVNASQPQIQEEQNLTNNIEKSVSNFIVHNFEKPDSIIFINAPVNTKYTPPTPPPLRTEYHQPHPLNACISADNCALDNRSELRSAKAKTISQSDNTDLDTDLKGGLAGAFAQMTLREPKSASQGALEEHIRRQGWEAGRIDYLGQDSFDNVWKKICETMSGPKKEPTPPKEIPEPAAVPKTPAPEAVPVVIPVPESVPTATPAPEAVPTATPVPESATTPVPVVEAPPTSTAVPVAPEIVPVAVPVVEAAPAPETVPAPIPIPTPEAAPVPAPEATLPDVPNPETTPTPVPAPETTPTTIPAPETTPTPVPAPDTTPSPAPESTPTPVPAPEATPTPVPAPEATPIPVPAPEATPTPVPAPEATPTPVTAPEATPTPVPAPEATPTPVPAPEATPTLVPAPEATPTPDPAPEATPTPVSASEATPTPVPAPEATPTPVPAPEATPTPAPAPETTPTPVPAPEATPAVVPTAEVASTLVPAPETTPAVVPVPEVIPAPVPASKVATTPEAIPAAKPIEETKSEESKSSEPAKVKPKAAKPVEEQKTAVPPPPAITETPATPQTPDASKELKPMEAPAAASASSETAPTPVPPPRKGSKGGNSGAPTKKPSKKKQ